MILTKKLCFFFSLELFNKMSQVLAAFNTHQIVREMTPKADLKVVFDSGVKVHLRLILNIFRQNLEMF